MLNSLPLNEEEISVELNRLEEVIYDKIDSINQMIHDEDKWVAEEIVMKKQPSTELSKPSMSLVYPKYDKKQCYYQ